MEGFTCGFWPPRETTFGEGLSAEPEALTIIDQEFESGRAAVAKQKDGAGERVAVETVTTQSSEHINALAEINRLISKHDGELRRQLNHKAFTSATDSGTRLRGVAGQERTNEASNASHQHARRVSVKTNQSEAQNCARERRSSATPAQRR